MKKNTRYALLGLGVCVALLIASKVAATANATVATVGPADLTHAIGARATVVPRGDVAHVMPTVAGRVTEVLVAVGDEVVSGETVVRLAPSDEAPSFDLMGENEVLGAPTSGTVLAVRVSVGDALSAIVPPPLPLLEIADLSALDLRIEVAEADAEDLAVGQTVRIETEGRVYTTTLSRVSPRIERRAYPLDDVVARAASRVRVAHAPLPEGFSPLAFTELDVVLEDAPVHVDAALPRTAILIREGRPSVRIRSGIFASDAFVTLGLCDDENVAVEGLEAGTEVILR